MILRALAFVVAMFGAQALAVEYTVRSADGDITIAYPDDYCAFDQDQSVDREVLRALADVIGQAPSLVAGCDGLSAARTAGRAQPMGVLAFGKVADHIKPSYQSWDEIFEMYRGFPKKVFLRGFIESEENAMEHGKPVVFLSEKGLSYATYVVLVREGIGGHIIGVSAFFLGQEPYMLFSTDSMGMNTGGADEDIAIQGVVARIDELRESVLNANSHLRVDVSTPFVPPSH